MFIWYEHLILYHEKVYLGFLIFLKLLYRVVPCWDIHNLYTLHMTQEKEIVENNHCKILHLNELLIGIYGI